MKTVAGVLIVSLCVGLLSCAATSPSEGLASLTGGTIEIEAMEAEVAQLMEKAGVPGLSCAILNDSQVSYVNAFGVKNRKTAEPLDPDTVFTGASFSKTVFAYVAMQLVEEGVLDLDRPLHEYLPEPLPSYEQYVDLEGDDRYRSITARMSLSHTTGFPNWRWFAEDDRLRFNFEPGERHAYSGEGIVLLQMIVEELTGKDLEELAREKVFGPLGMSRTDFVWQDSWSDNLASPHDEFERPRRFNRRHDADAAGSIATTPGDYAKLLVAVLNAEGERKATVDRMLKMQVRNRHAAMFGPRYREESDEFDFAGWGLGWGRFDCANLGRAIFHTGHDSGAQNYTVTFVDRGIGVVLMSNSDNLEGIARELTEAMIGDTCSPFDWMGYPRFDPAQRSDAPPLPVEIDVEAAILASYVGEYRMPDGRTLGVQLDDGRLVVSLDAGDWTPLLAETLTRFFMEDADERFTFVATDAKVATHLEIGVEGQVIRLERIEE